MMDIPLIVIAVLFVAGALRVLIGFKKASFARRLALVALLGALAAAVYAFIHFADTPMEIKVVYLLGLLGVEWVLLWLLGRSQVDPSGLDVWVAATLEWVRTGVYSVLIAFAIMSTLVQAFKIPSESMLDTLRIGDHLFVSRCIYGIQVPFSDVRFWKLRLREPRRGDIIVFRAPAQAFRKSEPPISKDYIKRLVGLPGDIVEMKGHDLYINDGKINEPHVRYVFSVGGPGDRAPRPGLSDYQRLWENGEFLEAYNLHEGIREHFGPVQVPPDHYLMMGDNRDFSSDSRYWGPLHKKYLKGKAMFIYWPPSRVRNTK